MRKPFIFSLLLFLVAGTGWSQDPIPYWKEVQALRQKDSLAFPAPGQTLFIGSSSFTRWTDVQDYFPKQKILNRAFGGSTLVDMIRFRYDVIYPYQPKQIVLYCGENDFASGDSVTVEVVMERFKTLYSLIRARYPLVPFLYVSMKPSPSRIRLMPKYEAANQQIKEFLKKQKKSAFADVYSKMLNADGSPMDDIFIQDRLHMNAKGYAIWKKILEKYLLP
ncbi:MAG: G-D-S-L family lipolytic protein [Sphingobacteriales bacterium]|nr:G-D-S-L family lipolytic protein [Sphingobacteriales bacterium]